MHIQEKTNKKQSYVMFAQHDKIPIKRWLNSFLILIAFQLNWICVFNESFPYRGCTWWWHERQHSPNCLLIKPISSTDPKTGWQGNGSASHEFWVLLLQRMSRGSPCKLPVVKSYSKHWQGWVKLHELDILFHPHKIFHLIFYFMRQWK